MQFVLNRDEFLAALALAAPVTDFRTTLPVLNYLKCGVQGETLSLTGTSLEVEAIAHCRVTRVKKASEVLIKGKQLFNLIKQLPPGDITIKVLDSSRVQLKADVGKWTVPGLDTVEDFPPVASVAEKPMVSYDNWQWWWAVDKVLHAVEKGDDAYRHTNCVLLEDTAHGAVLVATNGHRLSLCPLAEGLGLPESNTLMPAASLTYVKNAFGEAQGTVGLDRNENLLTFTTAAGAASIRLPDAEPINYRYVTDKLPEHVCVVNKEALLQAIKRASLFTDKVFALDFTDKGKFAVMVPDRPEGAAEEFVACDTEPPVACHILLNYHYCLEALATIDTDTVSIGYTDDQNPVWLRPTGDAAYFNIIMAMHAV